MLLQKLMPWSGTKSRRSQTAALEYLYDRERFETLLARERMRADRSGATFSVVIISLRTSAGHRLDLVHLARVLRDRLRFTDEAGHLGEERIGVFLPDTPSDGAWKVAGDVTERYGMDGAPLECDVYSYSGEPRSGRGPDYGDRDGALEPVADRVPSDAARLDAVPARNLEALLIVPLPAWKRGLDIVGAVTGLLLTAPLFAMLALLIKLNSRGSIFFVQWRDGQGGRPFKLYKFRTMRVGAEEEKDSMRVLSEQDGPAFKLRNDPRVFGLGSFLRQTSLDELPQLWNVLRGDMTLVGPRPLPCDESAECENWQRRRLAMVPGLTCIWQVRGRSTVSFDEWMRMDLEYLRKCSLRFDLKLILATVPAVLLRRGAY
jgi:lipopolysaccharide/colanic/teichoic acid biosynthesis glycosyltransferase